MKKYKADHYEREITVVDIQRQTPKHVLLSTGKKEKKSDFRHSYHDTWESAHTCLLERAATELQHALRRLAWAENHFAQIQGMKRTDGVDIDAIHYRHSAIEA